MRNLLKGIALAALLVQPSATNSLCAQDTAISRTTAADENGRRNTFDPGWLGLLGLGGLIGLAGRDRTGQRTQAADRSVAIPRA